MDFFFADDSRQRAPTRQGMNPLVGVGGIYVPSENVNTLERLLNQICVAAQFPPGEEFKWSPESKLSEGLDDQHARDIRIARHRPPLGKTRARLRVPRRLRLAERSPSFAAC